MDGSQSSNESNDLMHMSTFTWFILDAQLEAPQRDFTI